MKRPKIKAAHGPEYRIQSELIRYLRQRGWLVERMQGNLYQKGIPDLFIAHLKFGIRFIDVKNPGKYRFTVDQCIKWPQWEAHGVGIWILVAATDEEYNKLFAPPNYRDYAKPGWLTPLEEKKDALLDEL